MLHELEVPKKPDLTSIGHIFVMCRFSVMCRFRLSRAQQQSGNECTSLWTSASKQSRGGLDRIRGGWTSSRMDLRFQLRGGPCGSSRPSAPRPLR